LFPLISGIRGNEQTNLEPGFFNHYVGPFLVAAIVLLGFCSVIDWRRTTLSAWLRSAALPLAVGWILGLFLAFATSAPTWAVFAFALSGFAMCAVLVGFYRGVMARSRARGENRARAFVGSLDANRRRSAALVIHLGIILMAFGIIGSGALPEKAYVWVALGESKDAHGYTIEYEDFWVEPARGREGDILSARIAVYNDDRLVRRLVPKKGYYPSLEPRPWVSEVAIHSTWSEDLYVILDSWEDSGQAAGFQIVINPAIMWIWIGGGFLTLGGVIALWDRRRPAVSVSTVEDDAALEDEIEKEIMQLRQAGDRHGDSTCSACGARYPEGGLFCPQCGTKVG